MTIEERARKYVDKNFHRVAEEMPIEQGMQAIYIESATEQRKIDIDKAKNEFCKARCPLQYEECEKGFWKQGCLAYFNFSRAIEEKV